MALAGGPFDVSPNTTTLQLFGKGDGGDENGLGLDPGIDNEISGTSAIEIAFPAGSTDRTFSMGSATSPDDWTVYGSNDPSMGFTQITSGTDEGVDHSLPDDAFYVFAIGNQPNSSVLLATLDATVPLPPAVFLFGTVLAGLGFLSLRRKEGTALQAV